MAQTGTEFKNHSGGVLGVIKRDADGKLKGTSVGIEETIWLTEDEQVATANAPKRPENNPFTNGFLKVETEEGEIANRRPLRPAEGETPVAASPPEPVEGEQADGEVNATATEEQVAAKARAEAKKIAAEDSAKAQQAAAAKAAAQRATQPKEPADQGQAKPPATAKPSSAQGTRPATEAVATTPQAG